MTQACARSRQQRPLVHALTSGAKAFCDRFAFEPSPIDPMPLMVTLTDLEASL